MTAIRNARMAGWTAVFIAAAATAATGRSATAQGSGPAQESAAAQGVRCAERFTPLYDAKTGVLRCRRVEMRWVVTVCSDSAYALYQARPGADHCLPTPLPGVGTAPGVRGTRPITCAGPSYPIARDRVGDRDRCEHEQELFSLPLPATGPAGR